MEHGNFRFILIISGYDNGDYVEQVSCCNDKVEKREQHFGGGEFYIGVEDKINKRIGFDRADADILVNQKTYVN